MNAAFYNDMVSLAAALFAHEVSSRACWPEDAECRDIARDALACAEIFADEQAVFLEQRREARDPAKDFHTIESKRGEVPR
jgi:hypothetical protein